MVKHLALADEHYWFRCVVGGEDFGFFPVGPNAEWQLAPGETAEDVFRLYRDEIERANTIIAATPLDMAPRQPPSTWRPASLTRAWGSGARGSPACEWSCRTCSGRPPTTPGTSTRPPSSSTAGSGS